jgi:hypothetical protein
MGWKEGIVKIINGILEKFGRIAHPKTKTLSDLIIEHFKHKRLIVEKNYARLSKKDILDEPRKFIEALEKI